jgi:hypothetical protein
MEIPINNKNPQYCSNKCKYYSKYSASCYKYECELKHDRMKRLRCEECITDFGVGSE